MKTNPAGSARFPLLIYNLFFPLVVVAMLPNLLGRMLRRGNYRRKFGQRFGRYDAAVSARLTAHQWTWLHSISVGETFIALKLARQMRALDPSLHVVLSVTTSTGLALAEEQAEDWMEVIYNPLDALGFVRRALAAVRPTRLIFIEAIWPNLLIETRKTGVPVALIPRLSPRSEGRFRKVRRIVAPIFGQLNLLVAPEPLDRERWEFLGVAPGAIHVTGNIKFDYAETPPQRVGEFRALLSRLGVAADAPVLLGGSTFPGEERILGEVFCALRARHPGLFLIVVPRHVERTHEVAADLTALGLLFALRTGAAAHPADCLIVNTTGELRDWYHMATVVFIGKSLTGSGGQNPVEAVLARKPVVFGPNMQNFQPIVGQWLDVNAAIQVQSPEELVAKMDALLGDPAARTALVTRAQTIAANHIGATGRAAALLLNL